MTKQNVQIYGAGLSGLVAAINLVRKGLNVIVYEKEKTIGGRSDLHPSVHMTPMHLQQMEKYVGLDLQSCFSELRNFRGYIGPKKYVFSTKNLYVVERGPRMSSLDYFLYHTAVDEGVTIEFSHQLTADDLKDIAEPTIIATAGYSKIVKDMNLPYVAFKQFDTHLKTDLEGTTMSYFGDFTKDYGYISTKNGLLTAQLSGPENLSQKNLQKFTDFVKDTEGIELKKWSEIVSYFPKKARLFCPLADKTFMLAGDVAGFLDPFFGFGINGALISGKIAAMSVESKDKALQEFQRYTVRLNKEFFLQKIYWHLPFKMFLLSQVIKMQNTQLSLIRRSIPGFTDEDWLKII